MWGQGGRFMAASLALARHGQRRTVPVPAPSAQPGTSAGQARGCALRGASGAGHRLALAVPGISPAWSPQPPRVGEPVYEVGPCHHQVKANKIGGEQEQVFHVQTFHDSTLALTIATTVSWCRRARVRLA